MELITVIVPVYNVEKYINECVDSLISQTYKNLEIILVNDGSNDKSGAICDDYAERDKRIKVIHKQNEGLGFARNTGLRVAQGRFVTFMDSDDKAEKDLIEKLEKGICGTDGDTCIGGFKRITEDGAVCYEEIYDEAIFKGEDVYNKLFARMLGSAPDAHDAVRMSVWNVLYSMDVIQKYNIEFPSERTFISEDIIWDSEYYKHAKCAVVINSTAYNYRVTPGSLTQKYKPDMLDKICTLYNEMVKRLTGDKLKIIRLQRQFFVNLKVCIKQENPKLSKKTNAEVRRTIKTIVDNETVHRVAVEYEKVIKQKTQKMFVWLIKNKCTLLIYALIISERI